MDLLTALKISASGLSAQRSRVGVIASNLANANTTKSVDGGPYKRKQIYFEETGANQFEKHLDKADKKLSGVTASRVIEDNSQGPRIYDPSHPDADKEGYVSMPNVNVVTELTDIMAASRAYEANVMAMKSAKEMVNAVLQIGRS